MTDEELMERFRCPACGNLTDTPGHAFGCGAGRQERGAAVTAGAGEEVPNLVEVGHGYIRRVGDHWEPIPPRIVDLNAPPPLMEAEALRAHLATITAERDRVRAMLTPALAEVAAYRFAGPCTEAEFAEAKAVLAERDALRLVVDNECPVGALDLVTSLRAEAQLHREQVAALEAERDAARAAEAGLRESLRRHAIQQWSADADGDYTACGECGGIWYPGEGEHHVLSCPCILPAQETPHE